MRRPKAIFFDIGGTLATGGKLSPRRLLSARLGLTEKETRRAGRLMMVHPAENPAHLAAALAEILPGRERKRIDSVLAAVWTEQEECVREIPGATQLVKSLKEEGFKVGVISNTWKPLFEGFRNACPELAGLLDHQILSCRTGFKKPSVDLFKAAIEAAGEPPEACWMVGDTYELDAAPALRAGMRALWLLRRSEIEKNILVAILRGATPPPDWAAEGLDELLSFFVNNHGSSRYNDLRK